MVNNDLQKYWTLVSAHRAGKGSALTGLKLLARGVGRSADQARLFLMRHEAQEMGNTATP